LAFSKSLPIFSKKEKRGKKGKKGNSYQLNLKWNLSNEDNNNNNNNNNNNKSPPAYSG
jgi:hypothetical protein